MISSKELVLSTLEFRNTEGRIPRQLWWLPWAQDHYPDMMKKLSNDFEWDFDYPEVILTQTPIIKGDPHAVGGYTDEWGCVFININKGVMGEAKQPLVQDDEWNDADKIHIPEEILSFDIWQINASCANKKEKFLFGSCCPRPFEQLQFIRGTENLYMDLMDPPVGMLQFIEKMHDFYCLQLIKWAKTDVDALNIMDDWGSQNDLLINPKIWEKLFMPLYKEYIEIAHSHGKKIFMHSDGNILRILPKLIELGLDAINCQIFCMGIDKLSSQYKGKITFWGEIDRQNLIPYAGTEEIDMAVQQVFNAFWNNGGCIAQCEFGIGANPNNIYRIYEKWASLR